MINWDEQWAQFAENFYDGKAHISLGNATLLLLPGPGFGDLSHPTTRLMLQLMAGRVKNQTVLDIGCGSGILTLAALLLGAKSAIGIDIDPEALVHAKKNAKLNNLNATFTDKIPSKHYSIALMNMILPEQKAVTKPQADLWITSGILVQQRKEYHALTETCDWKLLEEKRCGEWLGFVFKEM